MHAKVEVCELIASDSATEDDEELFEDTVLRSQSFLEAIQLQIGRYLNEGQDVKARRVGIELDAVTTRERKFLGLCPPQRVIHM